MSDEDKSNEEVMSNYLDQNKIYRFEGDHGVENLNKICKELGYGEEGYKYGTSLERFLSDNPSCCDSIIEWITNNMNDEWKDSLSIDSEPEDESVIESNEMGPFSLNQESDPFVFSLMYDRECFGEININKKTAKVQNYSWQYIEGRVDERTEFANDLLKFGITQWEEDGQINTLND